MGAFDPCSLIGELSKFLGLFSLTGGYVYTLTLTDVATGWAECLPLLYRSQETVLAAIRRARTLYPFPIVGIDTENGGDFINEALITYCKQEHITFTRGRPLPSANTRVFSVDDCTRGLLV